LPYLNSRSHKSLMMNASPLSASTSAHPSFIGLDVFSRFSTDSILVGTPCRHGAYERSGRRSHSATIRVAVETGWPTFPASGW
jgi:hypothetical protein